MKEKKARVEDALHATRAALEEGILPGGGVALLRASKTVKPRKDLTHDEKTGYDIIVRACSAPIHQIAENAGQDGGVVVVQGRRRQGQLRLRRPERRVHRPGQGRHHRPDQGHPLGPPERRERQHPAAHLRRPDRRHARRTRSPPPAAATAAMTTCIEIVTAFANLEEASELIPMPLRISLLTQTGFFFGKSDSVLILNNVKGHQQSRAGTSPAITRIRGRRRFGDARPKADSP